MQFRTITVCTSQLYRCLTPITRSTLIAVALTTGVLLQACNNAQKATVATSDGDGRAESRDMLGNVLINGIYIDRGIAVRAQLQGASPEVVSPIVAHMQLNLVRLVYLSEAGLFSNTIDEGIVGLVKTLQADWQQSPFLFESHWIDDEPQGANLTVTEPVLPRVYPVGKKFAEIVTPKIAH